MFDTADVDFDIILDIMDKAKQPYYHYCGIDSEIGQFIVLVLDEQRDVGRHVPVMIFNAEKELIKTGVNWIDL